MSDSVNISSLSARERQIAQAYANGASHRVIAERLFIAPSTVRTHIQTIYRKMEVSTKLELFRALGVSDASPSLPTSLTLPDKPSIAVLRFSSLSRDNDKEYFADGISAEIISELSKFRDLFVISKSSSFRYEPNSMSAQKIGAELGVKHILEGSTQQDGAKLRITSQLIDAETGYHLWSERFDREAADLFAIQDEIVQRVAAAVFGRVKLATADRIASRSPISMEAYDYVLRGESIMASTKSDNERAREAFKKAIQLDAKCARGYVGLALCHVIAEFNAWTEPSDNPLKDALWYAERAISTDNFDAKAHAILGHVYGELQDFTSAASHLEKALDLNANDPDTYAYMGVCKEQQGQPEKAIEFFLRAMRLNPFYPAWYLWKLGTSYYFAGRYEDAVLPLKQAVARIEKFKRARLALAAAYAQIGQIEDANAQVSQLQHFHPGTSLATEQRLYYCWPTALRDDWLNGLRKAGLPE